MNQLEPMNGADAIWLRLDRPDNPLLITGMLQTDPLPAPLLREHLLRQLGQRVRFRQRVVQHAGLWFWETCNALNMDYHLVPLQAPDGADQSWLQAFVGRLLERELSRVHPLWQFVVIDNYRGGSVVLMRAHHCYADGLALVSVFGALTSDQDNAAGGFSGAADALGESQAALAGHLARQSERAQGLQFRLGRHEPASRSKRHDGRSATARHENRARRKMQARRGPGSGGSSGDGSNGKENAGHGVQEDWLAALRGGLAGLSDLAGLLALPDDPASGLRVPLAGRRVCAWSVPVPLTRFKTVARGFGASVNDVLLTIVAGGLRTLLSRHPAIPLPGSVHASLPVNLRDVDSPAEMSQLGNQFGTVLVSLGVGIENPVERLYQTKYEMRHLRSSTIPVLSHWMMSAAGMLPGRVAVDLLRNLAQKSSLVLSNVPGSRQPRTLCGRRVRELMFWVPQAGRVGLGISLLSYAEHVVIGLSADQAVVASPDELLDAMLAELERCEAALKTRVSPGPPEQPGMSVTEPGAGSR